MGASTVAIGRRAGRFSGAQSGRGAGRDGEAANLQRKAPLASTDRRVRREGGGGRGGGSGNGDGSVGQRGRGAGGVGAVVSREAASGVGAAATTGGRWEQYLRRTSQGVASHTHTMSEEAGQSGRRRAPGRQARRGDGETDGRRGRRDPSRAGLQASMGRRGGGQRASKE